MHPESLAAIVGALRASLEAARAHQATLADANAVRAMAGELGDNWSRG